MKSLTASIFLLLFLSCFVLGQNNDKPKATVIWSPDANCYHNNTAEVKALHPQCSTVQVDTVTFYIIRYGGVSYAMSHRPVRDYVVASVQISNRSDSPLQLNPSRSRLGRFKSAQDYLVNVDGAFASPESQGELRQATFREVTVIGEKEGEIRSGLRLKERYERNVERGKVIQRTNRAEAAAPQTEEATPLVITNSLLIPRAVFDNVLKSKTLAAGEKAAGHLVFKNDNEQKAFLVLSLNAGQVDFVFPVLPK